MKGRTQVIWMVILWSILATGAFAAEAWPKISTVLDNWRGEKKIVLRTTLADPLSSPLVQDLLQSFLDRGFTVTPRPVNTAIKEGLALDLRQNGLNSSLTLSEVDGTILAFDRISPVAPTPTVSPPTVNTTSEQVPSANPIDKGEDSPFPLGPLELSDHPRQIALLEGEPSAPPTVLLLQDDSLKAYRISARGMELSATMPAPEKALRALHLDAGPLTGKGRAIAAIWGEDVEDIYEGGDTRIHSWIIQPEGDELRPVSEDLHAYLRILGGRAYLQLRGTHQMFAGPVLHLEGEQVDAKPGDPSIAWGKTNLYEATPIAPEEMLVINSDGTSFLVDKETGDKVPGGTLMTNLGSFRGPEILVSLAEPEYRSGFSRQDRVTVRNYPMPTRMVVGADDSVYTLQCKRTSGVPLLSKPSGEDAVIRLVRSPKGLQLEHPFPGIESFIQDFALWSPASGPRLAVLLLNENEDGTGKSFLLFQRADSN